MIDLDRRKKLATHLRRFVAGQITNDEFEELLMNDVTYGHLPEYYYLTKECTNDDPVIRPMVEMAWGLYDDTRNHTLTGTYTLNSYARKQIARYVLFLTSDQPFTWEYFNIRHSLLLMSLKDFLKCFMTRGVSYLQFELIREQKLEAIKSTGDYEYWPFKTVQDFKKQLKKPPFLNGII